VLHLGTKIQEFNLDFSIKIGNPEKQRSACAVVGVFEARKLSPQAEAIDVLSKGYLSAIVRSGDMEGKLGSTLLLHNVPNVPSERVLLVGLGKEKDFQEKQYETAIRASIKRLNETGSADAVLYLTQLPLKKRDIAWRIEQAVLVSMASSYRFDQLKSKTDNGRNELRKLTLSVADRPEQTAGEKALVRGLAIASGISFTKDLGNLPGNICTPTYLAEQAVKLGKEYKLKVEPLIEL